MIPLPWLALGAVAAALAAGVAGYRLGGDAVEARWQRQAAEIRAQADAERQRMLGVADQLAAEYEAARASLQAQITRQRGQLREALNVPLPECPATVADVVVPRAAVGRLRSVAAGTDPPGSATGSAGAPVPGRP